MRKGRALQLVRIILGWLRRKKKRNNDFFIKKFFVKSLFLSLEKVDLAIFVCYHSIII